MRDGVILWSQDGRLLVANQAVARLMDLPTELVRSGVQRLEIMTFLARRGDYGSTEDPDGLARDLSDRFGSGEVPALTRRLPDGRLIRALSRRLEGGRLIVTYQDVTENADHVPAA